MTVAQLIEQLRGMDKNLEVFIVDSCNGMTQTCWGIRAYVKRPSDDMGSLCEVEDGTKVALITGDH